MSVGIGILALLAGVGLLMFHPEKSVFNRTGSSVKILDGIDALGVYHYVITCRIGWWLIGVAMGGIGHIPISKWFG